MDTPFLERPNNGNMFIDYEDNGREYDAVAIYNYATQLSHHFRNTLNIPRKSNVVLIFESGIANLVVFISCIMAGIVPIVLCPDDILKVKAIVKECSPACAFISPKVDSLLGTKIRNLFELPDIDERYSACIGLINDYKSLIKADLSTTLKLYSYYKQAERGNNSLSRPAVYHARQRMKWTAWKNLQNTPSEVAKRQYCVTVQKLLETHALLKNVLDTPQQVIELERLDPNKSCALSDEKPNQEDICFIQYSSGSTTSPKGVKITHANLCHNVGQLAATCHLRGDHYNNPTSISWLPHYHDMGLVGGYLTPYHLCTTQSGLVTYTMTPHYFLQNVQQVYEDLLPRVSSVELPNFAMRYFHDNVAIDDSLDLSKLRLVWCGSEKINRRVQREFVEKFGRNGFEHSALINCYGLAENTLIVSHGKYSDEVVNGVVSVGKPVDGTSYVIIDEETRERCPDNVTGTIYLSGKSCTTGYLNAALNRKAFTSIQNAEHYRTGDLGFTYKGNLYIQGRDCEKLVVNGKNMYPEDIEASLSSLQSIAIQDLITFSIHNGTTEKVIIVIAGSTSPDFNMIRIHLFRTFGFDVHNIVLVPPETLPKTSSSKKMRCKTRQMYLNEQLIIVDQFRNLPRNTDNTHLCREIVEDFCVFAEVDYEECKDLTLANLGVDSMAYSNYIQKIESRSDRDVCFDISAGHTTTLRQFYNLLLFVYGKIDVVDPMFLKDKGVCLSDELRQTMIDDSQISETDLPPYRTIGKGMAHSPDSILLIGATGFLGVYLLYELLKGTAATIVCLVRATDEAHAFRRVRNKVEEQDLPILENELTERCRFVTGDIEKASLGLSEEEFNYLSRTVDVVFHSAAAINYVASYSSFRETNVTGTKNVIKFCFQDQKKELHFVGTVLIFGWTSDKDLLETECNDKCEYLAMGYAQNKWVGEQLVLNSAKLGLTIKNYRPSFIISSISTKQYTSSDILVILLQYSIKHRIALSEDLTFDAVSADCCSKNILSLAKMDGHYGKTFHLTQSDGELVVGVYELVSERLGIEMKRMNLLEFVAYITRNATPNDTVYALIPFLNDNKEGLLRMRNKVYNNTWTKACFKESEIPYSTHTLQQGVDAVLDFMGNRQLL